MKNKIFLYFFVVLLQASTLMLGMYVDYSLSQSFCGMDPSSDGKYYIVNIVDQEVIDKLPSTQKPIDAEWVFSKQYSDTIVGLAHLFQVMKNENVFGLYRFVNGASLEQYKEKENIYVEVPNQDMRGRDQKYFKYFRIVPSLLKANEKTEEEFKPFGQQQADADSVEGKVQDGITENVIDLVGEKVITDMMKALCLSNPEVVHSMLHAYHTQGGFDSCLSDQKIQDALLPALRDAVKKNLSEEVISTAQQKLVKENPELALQYAAKKYSLWDHPATKRLAVLGVFSICLLAGLLYYFDFKY